MNDPNTDRFWLEACAGVLKYLVEEKEIPPGIETLYRGVVAHLMAVQAGAEDRQV